MFNNRIKHLFLLISLLSCYSMWAQFTIPSKPQSNMYVYDYVGLLNQQQKEHLQSKLFRYNDSTSTQIVIAIIDDLQGEDISMLGTKWAQEWGVGGKKEDNGIFILLQKDKRGPGGQIDIATGYGIEYRMTDRMTKQVINRVVIPNFKQNRYFEGLDQATDNIIAILSGEFEGNKGADQNGSSLFPLLFMLFIILLIILSKRNSGKGGSSGGKHQNGPSLLDMLILGSMGSSSGNSYGRGGFGGGGFGGGSFGGGSFGGGGASGRW